MTSPDLPQQSPSNSTDSDANHPEAAAASHTPTATQDVAPREHAASDASAHAQAHVQSPASSAEGGPSGEAQSGQGGSEKSEASDDDADDGPEDGPGGGNEQAAAGTPGVPGAPGTGKRKRRRRKKGGGANAGPHAPGANAGGANGAEGAPAEGAPEGGAEAGAEGTGDPNVKRPREQRVEKGDRKKKDRGPRPERERPAFNVGDVTFGKIIEITDDAIFVDMSGKGKAIFDRREMDLPDEPPPGADDHHAHDHDHDHDDADEGEHAEAAHADAEHAEGTGETAEAATASESVEAAPAEVAPAAEAPAAEAPIAEKAAAIESPAAVEATATERATEASGTEAAAAPAEGAEAPAEPAEPVAQPIWPAIILEVGQQFVGAVHNDGGRGGLIVLTRHPRRAQRAKLVVAGAFKERGEVLGLVTGVIKGGVEVDVDGLRAFAPGSHMDLRLGSDLSPLVGKRLMFQVTQYAKKGRDVVLSRRAFLETEAKAARAEALANLQVGSIVEGTVRSVVSFGAFIDVGGVEGLVPLSEMSHNRGDGPHDVFKQNEKTPVKILRVDEKGKIWLSRRAAIPDPWSEVAKKYPMGSKHTGTVARLQPFGVFVELESGIDGLIHTADLSIKRIEHPSEVVKEGESIDVIVAHLDIGAHKIGLHPAPVGAAAEEAPQRVQVQKMLKVAVVGHDPGGLIVRILGATGRHARGFISGAATGTPRGTDLRKSYPLNTILDAKVVELDPRRGEVKLSIKAMQDDTERSAYRQYREQVTRESKFGTFADLLNKKKESAQK